MILWVEPNSCLDTAAQLRLLLQDFQKENPGIKVEFRVLTRQHLWQELFSLQRQARPHGQLPDLVQIPHFWTALFSKLDIIQNLSEFSPALSASQWIEPLRPHCFLPGTASIFSVPWWMEVSALHYRVDHFEQVVKNPDDLLREWPGFLEACSFFHRKKRVPNYYPVENPNTRGSVSLGDLIPLVWNNGGDIFSQDMTRSVIHREEAMRGMEDYLALFRNGYMPLMHERGSMGTMLEGNASMAISTLQMLGRKTRDPNMPPIRTLPMPRGRLGSFSLMASANLAIVKDSKHKEEAFKLLQWLCSGTQQKRHAEMIDAFPCSAQGFEEFMFSSQELMETYSGIIASARTLPNITVCGTYTTVMDGVLNGIARAIADDKYSSALLLQEMIKIQVEMDYLLSLYGD
ncbi:MAG TPA: extracellular solute-binding protein [Elusimicrobiales bacterium]|nr:extracellular solute-binding protein [Elusimicrobiales bacterium]